MTDRDELARLTASFAEKGGKVTKGATVHTGYGAGAYGTHPAKKQTVTEVVGAVRHVKEVTYRGGKYAGHVVTVVEEDGKLHNFMSSKEFALRLILGRRYAFAINFNVNKYPTGKGSGVEIDGALKQMPVFARTPSAQPK